MNQEIAEPRAAEPARHFRAVTMTRLTESLGGKLPTEVSIGADERLVVVPRTMSIAAKPDIPNV